MQYLRTLFIAGLIATTSGCASGLNSYQKSEMQHFEASGLAVEEKSTGAGTALGLLPGGGSFYGREYGLGVVNLLFWPLSILWDPVSGYNAAQTINYHATKQYIRPLQDQEMSGLDDKLTSGEIDLTHYTLQKRKIEDKYRYN
ncbi:MAG: hypothetical protein LPK18_04040 [Pseudomonadaceae bacterium]|nr:hypothetical protein [Pseudomonadaceae bacterium]